MYKVPRTEQVAHDLKEGWASGAQKAREEACKETRKHGPCTGEKSINTNCPYGNPDVGLTKQRLPINYFR